MRSRRVLAIAAILAMVPVPSPAESVVIPLVHGELEVWDQSESRWFIRVTADDLVRVGASRERFRYPKSSPPSRTVEVVAGDTDRAPLAWNPLTGTATTHARFAGRYEKKTFSWDRKDRRWLLVETLRSPTWIDIDLEWEPKGVTAGVVSWVTLYFGAAAWMDAEVEGIVAFTAPMSAVRIHKAEAKVAA